MLGPKPASAAPRRNLSAISADQDETASLAGSDDTPCKDNEAGPFMGWDDAPHKGLELEKDIANVEDCKKPVVAVVLEEVKGAVHAGDAGVAYVGAVEKGEEVCDVLAG